jgi:hypothetical protein
MGQEDKPAPKLSLGVPTPELKLQAAQLSPQAMLRAMLAQERTNLAQAGATVEVIGYEDEAAMKLLSIHAVEQVRLNFHIMDKQSQRELYALMHQDPSHPALVLFVLKVAGGPSAKADAEWLK